MNGTARAGRADRALRPGPTAERGRTGSAGRRPAPGTSRARVLLEPGAYGIYRVPRSDPLGGPGPTRTQVRVGSSRPRSTTSVGDLRSVGRRPRDVGRRTGGGQ